MNRVCVTDIGMLTAMGDAPATWEGLMAGCSALAPVQRFSTAVYTTNVAGSIDALDGVCTGSRLDALVEWLFTDRTFPQDAHVLTAST